MNERELEELREQAQRRYLVEPAFHARARAAAQVLEVLHVLPGAELLAEREQCLSAAIISLHTADLSVRYAGLPGEEVLGLPAPWPVGLRERLDEWARHRP